MSLPVTSCEDSEKAIVSICLTHPGAISQAMQLLPNTRCIFNDRYRTVFEAIVHLNEEGIGIDPLSLIARLKDVELLETVGGISAVNDLPNDALPKSHLEGFCNTVVDWYKKRKAYDELKDLQSRIFDRNTSIDSIGKVRARTGSTILKTSTKRKEWLKFYSPLECAEWEPPSDWVLVGNNHIQRSAKGHPHYSLFYQRVICSPSARFLTAIVKWP